MRGPLLILLGLSCSPAFAARFVPIDGAGMQLVALSSDGRAASGDVVGGATGGFRWDDSGRVTPLPASVSVQGISASGRYVVGSALDDQQREVAAYWDGDSPPVRIGGLSGAVARGGVLSVGLAIDDEPEIVGTANTRDDHRVAFAWARGAGMRRLPAPENDDSGGALGVDDGAKRIVGWSGRDESTRHIVIWEDGRVRPRDPSFAAAELTGVSGDAQVLLGWLPDATSAGRAFRWTRAAGLQPLSRSDADLPLPVRFAASSADGRLLAGSAGQGAQRVAIVWTPDRAIERLDDWLWRSGIQRPPGWTLLAATAVSADGRRLGGYGLCGGQFRSFIIDLRSAETAADAAGGRSMALRRPTREDSP